MSDRLEAPASPWPLSGFGDEIAEDFDEQLDALLALGIRQLDLRAAWGRNVVDLDDAQVATIAAALEQRGMQVVCVASPVGKSPIDGDVRPELERLRRALAVAAALGAPWTRVFSFYIPAGDDAARWREQALERLEQMTRLAEIAGVGLLHENERGIWGDSPERCLDLLLAIDSPSLRAVWEPCNFLSAGYAPHPQAFDALRPWIAHVHVKDYIVETRRIVPAGEGDADWPATLEGLRASGYDGALSLEPHLQVAGAASGFSGPDLFAEAVAALRGLLAERGMRAEG